MTEDMALTLEQRKKKMADAEKQRRKLHNENMTKWQAEILKKKDMTAEHKAKVRHDNIEKINEFKDKIENRLAKDN